MSTKIPKRRGLNIINAADLFRVSGQDKFGNRHNVKIENRGARLSYHQKIEMYKRCAPVFGVVTSRANRMSTLDYSVAPMRSHEDELAAELKVYRELYEENMRPGLYHSGVRIRAYLEIKRQLHDIFPDLSNFEASLKRWKRRLKVSTQNSAAEIEDFFAMPAPNLMWNEYIKMSTQDLLVHGSFAEYKMNGNLYPLPGGSVFPIQSQYVGGPRGFVQIPIIGEEPQLFFNDEVSFSQYMPNTNIPGGMTPLEALVNMVAGNILFGELMANRSDGTEKPQKLLVFGEPDQQGDYPDMEEIPIDADDQERMENLINEEQKDKAVKIISGYGHPIVLDLSKAETIPILSEWQNKSDMYVAMVFNASNQEINQTGGDGTSGRSTSETQERADNSKGIFPFVRINEDMFTYQKIPFMFGPGWKMTFSTPLSEKERIEIATMKVTSGIFDPNSVRVNDFNEEPYPEPEYDRPVAQQPSQPASANDIASLLGAI